MVYTKEQLQVIVAKSVNKGKLGPYDAAVFELIGEKDDWKNIGIQSPLEVTAERVAKAKEVIAEQAAKAELDSVRESCPTKGRVSLIEAAKKSIDAVDAMKKGDLYIHPYHGMEKGDGKDESTPRLS
jgi:negative regulator of genetic competence, sporulation and motility